MDLIFTQPAMEEKEREALNKASMTVFKARFIRLRTEDMAIIIEDAQKFTFQATKAEMERVRSAAISHVFLFFHTVPTVGTSLQQWLSLARQMHSTVQDNITDGCMRDLLSLIHFCCESRITEVGMLLSCHPAGTPEAPRGYSMYKGRCGSEASRH